MASGGGYSLSGLLPGADQGGLNRAANAAGGGGSARRGSLTVPPSSQGVLVGTTVRLCRLLRCVLVANLCVASGLGVRPPHIGAQKHCWP